MALPWANSPEVSARELQVSDPAKPEDFQRATHRVYRSMEHPTSLKVGMLPVAKPVFSTAK